MTSPHTRPRAGASAKKTVGEQMAGLGFPFPWEKRGFGFYLPSTHKRILEVPFAWKTSVQAKAITDFVARAIDSHDDLIEAAQCAENFIAGMPLSDDQRNTLEVIRAALSKAVSP